VADIRIGNKCITGIDLFVFDKDGTIMDLYSYWYHMVELRAVGLCEACGLPENGHKAPLMSEMGIDIPRKRLKPEGPVGLFPREVVQAAAENYLSVQGCKDVSRTCFDVFKKVDERSIDLLTGFIKPIDGALKLLNDIKQKKASVAIATTDKTRRAELAVDFLNIRHAVDLVVGSDMVKSPKPAPDMLEYIGSKLNIPAQRSVVIGDARTDIQMGISAKFKASIAVLSGLTTEEELKKLTPYVVEDVSKIAIE
jgi:phosphoglycolate phosphatase-like HAD superfamily hydrolase